MGRIKLKDRLLPFYTKGEEIFNMVTHIIGGGLGVVALTLCIIKTALINDVAEIVSGIAYGVSLIILYTMSSVYHGLKVHSAKKVFQIFDHCAIYIFIAGTYTPYTVIALQKTAPVIGWIIFGFVWGLTALAVTLTAIDLKMYRIFSFVCYIVMGWCIIFAIVPLYKAIDFWGTFLLVLGGILYSVGCVFFKMGKKHRYAHSVFHLFVLVASISHFISIFFFVM